MGKNIVWVLLLAGVISEVVSSSYVEKVLSSVPEKERIDFLKYHAERGYQLETSGQATDYQKGLPDEFSLEIYRTLLPQSVDNAIILNALACIVCWPNGKCVDLCNPGVHPV